MRLSTSYTHLLLKIFPLFYALLAVTLTYFEDFYNKGGALRELEILLCYMLDDCLFFIFDDY